MTLCALRAKYPVCQQQKFASQCAFSRVCQGTQTIQLDLIARHKLWLTSLSTRWPEAPYMHCKCRRKRALVWPLNPRWAVPVDAA